MRSNDVLPAPLAPMITQRSSSSTDQLTGPTSRWPSRRSETSLKSISRSGLAASLVWSVPPSDSLESSGFTSGFRFRALDHRAVPRRRGGLRVARLFGWDLDASHHTVDRVRGLDLAARDAEQEQHGVQVRVAQ